jgi:hypothetical protein
MSCRTERAIRAPSCSVKFVRDICAPCASTQELRKQRSCCRTASGGARDWAATLRARARPPRRRPDGGTTRQRATSRRPFPRQRGAARVPCRVARSIIQELSGGAGEVWPGWPGGRADVAPGLLGARRGCRSGPYDHPGARTLACSLAGCCARLEPGRSAQSSLGRLPTADGSPRPAVGQRARSLVGGGAAPVAVANGLAVYRRAFPRYGPRPLITNQLLRAAFLGPSFTRASRARPGVRQRRKCLKDQGSPT